MPHSSGRLYRTSRSSDSDDINYVLPDTGLAVCDGKEERLPAAICYICPKGAQRCIINTGDNDLVLLIIVVER